MCAFRFLFHLKPCSTTLGSISNSPSACFVASDGLQLRVYQAVIDARTLLAEVLAAACRKDNADVSYQFCRSFNNLHNYKQFLFQNTDQAIWGVIRDRCSEHVFGCTARDWPRPRRLHPADEVGAAYANRARHNQMHAPNNDPRLFPALSYSFASVNMHHLINIRFKLS